MCKYTPIRGLVYEAYTPRVGVLISDLLLYITTNTSSSIGIEECNFLSVQLGIQYWPAS